MYYSRKSNPQNPDWVTVRGTSKLEGYHPHLARALPGTGYSLDTAGGIFALFNMQWNLKRGVQNKGDPDTGTVEPWLQNNLAQLSRALQLPSDIFQTVSIPASTGELFGVEYVPDALDEEAAQEAEQQGRAEVEAELAEEDEALLAAAALDAMRLLGRPDCNVPDGPLHFHITTAHVTSVILIAYVQMATHLQHPLGACAMRPGRLSRKRRPLHAPTLQLMMLPLSRRGGDSQPACSGAVRACHQNQARQVICRLCS